MCVCVCVWVIFYSAKTVSHSEIFIRAIPLKCSNIENKAISCPTYNEIIL